MLVQIQQVVHYLKMKAKIYSDKELIGISELQITDESMGVVSGKFIPNNNYKKIRNTIWNFHDLTSDKRFKELNELRINCQLENEVFLYPIGGFLITDIKELPNEEKEFEAVGNYRHLIEDNFLSTPPKERILEPWEYISVEQKIIYENELFKEIGKNESKRFLNFFKPKNHKLNEYEFNAMAKMSSNDEILFTLRKKGENKFEYAVINLTWKGKLEKNDNFPRTEYFESFKDFFKNRLLLDNKDWTE